MNREKIKIAVIGCGRFSTFFLCQKTLISSACFDNEYSNYWFACIFTTDTAYEHLMFLDDINKKGKIKFGKNNTVVDADITLNNGVLTVVLNDNMGNIFSKQFKYEGQYEYSKDYEVGLRKNADIMCCDLDDDGHNELLIGLSEGIAGVEDGISYNNLNYCIAWCIRYDENTGFTLCDGDMFSKGQTFSINSYVQKLNVPWEQFGEVTGYYLEGNKIIETY